MRHLKRVTCLFLLGGIFALLALFSTPAARVHAESMAYIRIIHAATGVGVVDVFVDGNKLLSSFQFGVVTPYVPLPAGGHNVQIALIGTGVGASVITQSIMVNAGTPYTVAALGTQASGFSLAVFTDDNLAANNNEAKVRVYHLSPNAGTVSVSNGASLVASGLTYQKASDYVNIPAGSYTLDATIPSNQNVPIDTNLQPWTITSVFAIGVVSGTPAIQFISAQVAGIPSVPGTGSDPSAVSTDTQPLMPWMFGTLFFLVIAASFATRRHLTRTHD
ncbi:MAG: DUF4397 domain-containing protein [Ktedonobacteraceae bacterium]